MYSDFLQNNLYGEINNLHAGNDREASEEAEVSTNSADLVLQFRGLVLGDPVKCGTVQVYPHHSEVSLVAQI